MKLSGKIALVTGAGRGIGQAIALKLANEGADLMLCARSAGALEETAAQIRALGRKAEIYPLDVSDSAAVDACMAKTIELFGRIDLLVNNAGVTKDTLMIRMKDEDWDEVLRINLKGAFIFGRAAAKVMMKQRSGSIINITSVIGLIGNAGQCNYAASKAGLIGLTKSMAKELAGRGVRVNAVAPGFIVTQMTDVLPEAVKSQLLAKIPLGRLGAGEDIANAVAFLASEDAGFITGQTLTVDGGMVM